MDYNKHYIRLQGDTIIAAFSDAFQQPLKDDICVNEKGDRHFNLELINADGYYRLKWDGKQIVEKSNDEIYTAEVKAKIESDAAKQSLIQIDLSSIRSILEYIASKADCPATLKEHEADAIKEREKVK